MPKLQPFALVYGGKFEDHLNQLFGSSQVAQTAKILYDFEVTHKAQYRFGNWAKKLVPKEDFDGSGFDDWDANSQDVDKPVADQVTNAIRGNLLILDKAGKSTGPNPAPKPMFFKISENIFPKHDVKIINDFSYKETLYTAIWMLCKNPKLG